MENTHRNASASSRIVLVAATGALLLAGLASSLTAATPTPAATSGQDVMVLYDGFEGPFPSYTWTTDDSDGGHGFDGWGNTTYRSVVGTQSVWSASLGGQTNTNQIYSEDFESGSLPGGWSAADSDSGYGD